MKRLLLVFVAALAVVFLCACGADPAVSLDHSDPAGSQQSLTEKSFTDSSDELTFSYCYFVPPSDSAYASLLPAGKLRSFEPDVPEPEYAALYTEPAAQMKAALFGQTLDFKHTASTSIGSVTLNYDAAFLAFPVNIYLDWYVCCDDALVYARALNPDSGEETVFSDLQITLFILNGTNDIYYASVQSFAFAKEELEALCAEECLELVSYSEHSPFYSANAEVLSPKNASAGTVKRLFAGFGVNVDVSEETFFAFSTGAILSAQRAKELNLKPENEPVVYLADPADGGAPLCGQLLGGEVWYLGLYHPQDPLTKIEGGTAIESALEQAVIETVRSDLPGKDLTLASYRPAYENGKLTVNAVFYDDEGAILYLHLYDLSVAAGNG